jgi:DNA-directed RNA polymerase subunit RPC12/RpoP
MAKATEPGKWYLVVNCAGCGEPIPFAETVSPEERPELQYQTITNLACPRCGHVDTYAPALMSREPGPETGGIVG